jgi:hypothetical protein
MPAGEISQLEVVRTPVDLDAPPREDLALPISGQVIAVFGDRDMGKQGGTLTAASRSVRNFGGVTVPPGDTSRAIPVTETSPIGAVASVAR